MNIQKAQLPKGWEIKKLGEVVDVLDNLRKPITKRNRIEGEYPYYGATGILSFVHNYIFSEKLVLIGEDGAKWVSGDNTSFIAEGKYWVNNHAHVIRPNRNIIIDEWIVYFLNFSDLTPFITGMTVPKLNQEKMRSIPIPLPSLPEQKRIVSILDEAFAAIAKAKANAEQNLKNARELFESYLQAVFESGNWETKKLNEITEVKDGTHDSPKYITEGIPFVTQKNIKVNGLSFFDTKFITETDHQKFYKRSNVTLGDILISMIGANRGMVAIVDDRRVFSIKNVGLIKSSMNINMHYLLYYLKSPLAKKYVLYMSNGGAQEFIGLTALRSFPIPIPTMKEQDEIVKKLDQIALETNKLETIYQGRINYLEELKKTILQKAFSGQLSESGFSGLMDEPDLSGSKKSGKYPNQVNPDSDNVMDEPDLSVSEKSGKYPNQVNQDSNKVMDEPDLSVSKKSGKYPNQVNHDSNNVMDEPDLSVSEKSGKYPNQVNHDSNNVMDEPDLSVSEKSGKSSNQVNPDSDNVKFKQDFKKEIV